MPDADTQVDDDTCIALAMLHGCQFHNEGCEDDPLWWIANDVHLADQLSEISKLHTGYYGAPSRGWLAREYCKYHGLI